MKACRKMRKMRIDPYPDVILCQGLHKKEPKETADPILEETMMYMAMAGVKVLSDVGQTNERVDALSLEISESVAKCHVNINKVDRRFTKLDHRVELVEESRCHYQEFLAANTGHHQTPQWEVGVLQMRCDGLVRTN